MNKQIKIFFVMATVLVLLSGLNGCNKQEAEKTTTAEPAAKAEEQATPTEQATTPDTQMPEGSQPEIASEPEQTATQSETGESAAVTETTPASEGTPATPATTIESSPPAGGHDDMLALARKSGCLACHSVDKKVVGPAWKDVAARYKGNTDARAKLIEKVSKGGRGNWTEVTGNVAMPPYSPRVSPENIEQLVDFVLSLADKG